MPLRITNPDPRQLQRLLHGLPEGAVDELAGTARQITYRAGEVVMGEGERWTPGVVTEGTVRLTVRAHDGREATLRLVGRGVVVGLVAMFEPDYASGIYEKSMSAVERSTVIFFDPATLLRLAHQHPDFALHLLRGTIEWGGALTEAACQYVFMNVRQRVAGYLLNVATSDPSGSLVAQITQQQLANAVGSVREVVARTLHDLRAAGLISVSRAHVAIIDRNGLMRTAFDAN